jgi:hypothetical protein
MKIAMGAAKGLLFGVGAYVVLILLTRLGDLYAGRNYDWETAFKEILLPLSFFDLFSQDGRQLYPAWAVRDMFAGVLLVFGLTLWFTIRASRGNRQVAQTSSQSLR